MAGSSSGAARGIGTASSLARECALRSSVWGCRNLRGTAAVCVCAIGPNLSGVQTPGGVAAPSSPVKSSAAGPVAAADTAVTTSGGTVGTIPKFSTSSGLVDSPIKEVNGEVTVQNLGNIFFADQFTDGVPGAIAACPPEGCIIYAGSKNVNRNLGTINPGKQTRHDLSWALHLHR